MKNPDTGLDMYYKMTINADFMDVNLNGQLKELSELDITHMVENVKDVELWGRNIPAKSFEFNGFVVCTLVNVTPNELLSQLKNNLLERDALLTEQQFEKIRHNVRSLFNVSDLRVGLGVFKDGGGIMNFGHWSWRDLICKGRIKNISKEFKGSIYQKVFDTGAVSIVENIEEIENPTGIENAIKETCVKSFVIAPLKYHDKIIGYLELGSCSAKVLNPLSMAQVAEILPLFSVAIQRSVEERRNKVDAIIMEKCTAIHNSVQWRFQKAAKKYLMAREQGLTDVEMEPIVFKDVYPLFGMSDIRASSVHRNIAIQADLITQLEMAQQIILKAKSLKEFPILDEINFRIDKLVHDEPMAIRFRADEKKFDVDGAYNMRYEIIKKRIDKALIKIPMNGLLSLEFQ